MIRSKFDDCAHGRLATTVDTVCSVLALLLASLRGEWYELSFLVVRLVSLRQLVPWYEFSAYEMSVVRVVRIPSWGTQLNRI